MKDITHYVDTKNWPTDLDQAKEFAIEGINAWVYKKKASKFINEVNKATSIKRVQQLVIYPLLSGEGLSVIK